jgi:hypothetical protein
LEVDAPAVAYLKGNVLLGCWLKVCGLYLNIVMPDGQIGRYILPSSIGRNSCSPVYIGIGDIHRNVGNGGSGRIGNRA